MELGKQNCIFLIISFGSYYHNNQGWFEMCSASKLFTMIAYTCFITSSYKSFKQILIKSFKYVQNVCFNNYNFFSNAAKLIYSWSRLCCCSKILKGNVLGGKRGMLMQSKTFIFLTFLYLLFSCDSIWTCNTWYQY